VSFNWVQLPQSQTKGLKKPGLPECIISDLNNLFNSANVCPNRCLDRPMILRTSHGCLGIEAGIHTSQADSLYAAFACRYRRVPVLEMQQTYQQWRRTDV